MRGAGTLHAGWPVQEERRRIAAPVPPPTRWGASSEPGVSLELRIYAPDIEWPLMIDAASVQWVSGQTFGLAFFRIRETEQQRLGQVIGYLVEGGEDRVDH